MGNKSVGEKLDIGIFSLDTGRLPRPFRSRREAIPPCPPGTGRRTLVVAEVALALVLLAGGPGQSATRDFVALGPVLERLRMDRDVVLVDARGTGRSTPLRCRDDRSFADKLAGVGDSETLIALAPGSVWATKRWPSYDALAGDLVARLPAARVVVLGAAGDAPLAAAIRAAVQQRGGRMVLLVGDNVAVAETLQATGLGSLIPILADNAAAEAAALA